MRSPVLFLLPVLLLAPWLAWAQVTVNYHAGLASRNVVDASGTILADGNTVEIGAFPDGFDVQGRAADWVSLRKAWHTFDATTITNWAGQGGRFAGSASRSDSSFDGRRIHLWIFKTNDGQPPRPDAINVEEYGLFSSSAPNWLFPQTGSLPPANTTTISSSQVTDCPFGAVEADVLHLALVVRPVLLSLEDWRRLWFTTSSPPAGTEDAADPDTDGLVNLAEYALGLNPLTSDSAFFHLGFETADDQLKFFLAFTRRKDRPDAAVRFEGSTDLTQWLADEVGERVVFESPEWKRVHVGLFLDRAARFLHLSVGSPAKPPSAPP